MKYWSAMLLAAVAALVVILMPIRTGTALTGGSSAPDGFGWVIETVDSQDDVGRYASLALDPAARRPHIGFYDETNGHLKLAVWRDTMPYFGPGNSPTGGPSAGRDSHRGAPELYRPQGHG